MKNMQEIGGDERKNDATVLIWVQSPISLTYVPLYPLSQPNQLSIDEALVRWMASVSRFIVKKDTSNNNADTLFAKQ